MKSYTDIEQSMALSKILPLETADMCYIKHSSSYNPNWEFNEDFPPMILGNVPINEITAETLPCWSLAALLDILPDESEYNQFLTLQKEKNEYCCCYEDINGDSFRHIFADNPVDACYEMIIKLHEQTLL